MGAKEGRCVARLGVVVGWCLGAGWEIAGEDVGEDEDVDVDVITRER